jgi:hypothetical protein
MWHYLMGHRANITWIYVNVLQGIYLDLTVKYTEVTNCVGQKPSQNSPPWPQEPSITESTESHLTQDNIISLLLPHPLISI